MDAINNDRGIHVMKAIWAYQNSDEDREPKSKEKPDHFVDGFYVKGVEAEEDKKIKKEMQDLLIKWEEGDKEVRENWKKLRDWTYKGFKETYKTFSQTLDQYKKNIQVFFPEASLATVADSGHWIYAE